jgi:hypothetical protein
MPDATSFTNRNDSVEKFEDHKPTLEEREQTIRWLQLHNYPALPVAPAQSAYEYHKVVQSKPEQGIWQHCPLTADRQPIPLYTGKNPSYLDAKGIPHLVNHRSYQKRFPDSQELKTWFANPANGVGTLGGWNNTVWLDFDVKQFPAQEECDAAVLKILEHPELQQTFIERTHSGGWRIGVRVKHKPNFTNFSLTPGGAHVGEALFEGRFTVLAPTIGPSLNTYQSLNRALPVEVESLESIGIYPTSTKRQRPCLTPPPALKAAIPGSIPLEMLGHDESQEILRGADPRGDRSSSLATALNEWYGWQNWTLENGIAVRGTPIELAHHAGAALGIDSERVNRIIKSIDAASCQPAALYLGGEESCWKKIYKLDRPTFKTKCPAHIQDAIKRDWSSGNNKGSGGSGGGRRGNSAGSGSGNGNSGNGEDFGKMLQSCASSSINTAAIKSHIRDILIQNLPPDELQAAKIKLRTENPALTEREINKLFDTVEQQLELDESRHERREEVDNLLRLGDQSLNLNDFLPPDLAHPLNRLSEFMNIRPEVGLLSLLAAASSLHKVGTELAINRSEDFTVPPTIFAGLVSESGQKKSPILKAIVKKPLSVLQREKREAFQEASAQYEKDIATWDKCKADERESKFPQGKPIKPQQRLYYFTNYTNEGLIYQVQAHPDKALLALVDELVGLFASQNKYSGGRGSDRQDLLSAFDGTGATVLRANGTRADLEELLLSIFGTIQPEVLKGLMRDCSDPDGHWARFLFVHQPLAAATLPEEDSGGFDLTDRILGYYRAIDRLPAIQYRLSREAYKRYKPVYDQLEKLRVSHPSPGMRAVYSKMEGYIGRLALNLHVLFELSSGKSMPCEEIPLVIMEMAIALAKFFIGQVKLIHANVEAELAPQLVKLINLSKRFDSVGKQGGWVKTADFQKSFTSTKQPKADVARSWMKECSALGFGKIRGKGASLEFHWNPDIENHDPTPTPPIGSIGNNRQEIGDLPIAEMTPNQVFEEIIGSIGTSISFAGVTVLEKTTELVAECITVKQDDVSPHQFQKETPSPKNRLNGCDAGNVDISSIGDLPNPDRKESSSPIGSLKLTSPELGAGELESSPEQRKAEAPIERAEGIYPDSAAVALLRASADCSSGLSADREQGLQSPTEYSVAHDSGWQSLCDQNIMPLRGASLPGRRFPAPAPSASCPLPSLQLPHTEMKRCNSKMGLWLLQLDYLATGQTKVTYQSPFPENKKYAQTLATIDPEQVKSGVMRSVASLSTRILEQREAQAAAESEAHKTYRVRRLGGTLTSPEFIWIKGCKLVEKPNLPVRQQWIFSSPDGYRLAVAGEEEFELEAENS